MNRPAAHLLRIFVTGLLAALPLAATVLIFGWLLSLLYRWLGPQSMVGGALVRLGLGVTGSEVVGYLMGIGFVAASLFALGLLVEAGLQRGLSTVLSAVLKRIPLVGTVYGMLQKMVGLFAQRDEDGVRSMSAVWCHFGGADSPDAPPRAAVLALLSTPEPVLIGGRPYLGVIVPTAPVPVGGGLLFLPAEWVTPADVGMEALTSIYVSMGVTSSQYLPSR
jgi:uncharacterized membrane protein